jgi:hypothetical protein
VAIENNVTRVQYISSGQASFSYPFEIFEKDDIVVYVDGTLKVRGTDYNVTGEGEDNGGTVTFITDHVPSSGAVIVMYREIPTVRTIDYQEEGAYRAVNINEDIDRLWMKLQEHNRDIDRSLKLEITDTSGELEIPTQRANKIFGFDAASDVKLYTPATIGQGITTVELESVEELTLLELAESPSHVLLKGYYTPGDGGEGMYYKDGTDNSTVSERFDSTGRFTVVDNNGNRWKQLSGSSCYNFSQIGMRTGAGNASSNTTKLNALIASTSASISLMIGFETYYFDSSIIGRSNVSIEGIDPYSSILHFGTPSGFVLMVFNGTLANPLTGVRLRNFGLKQTARANNGTYAGIYFNSVHDSLIENIVGTNIDDRTVWALDCDNTSFRNIKHINEIVVDYEAERGGGVISMDGCNNCILDGAYGEMTGIAYTVAANDGTIPITFDGSSDVDPVTDSITLTAHGRAQGEVMRYDNGGGTSIGGLTHDVYYWLVALNENAIRVASSHYNAIRGIYIDITADGVGASHKFHLSDNRSSSGRLATEATGNVLENFSAYKLWSHGLTSNGCHGNIYSNMHFELYEGDEITRIAVQHKDDSSGNDAFSNTYNNITVIDFHTAAGAQDGSKAVWNNINAIRCVKGFFSNNGDDHQVTNLTIKELPTNGIAVDFNGSDDCSVNNLKVEIAAGATSTTMVKLVDSDRFTIDNYHVIGAIATSFDIASNCLDPFIGSRGRTGGGTFTNASTSLRTGLQYTAVLDMRTVNFVPVYTARVGQIVAIITEQVVVVPSGGTPSLSSGFISTAAAVNDDSVVANHNLAVATLGALNTPTIAARDPGTNVLVTVSNKTALTTGLLFYTFHTIPR